MIGTVRSVTPLDPWFPYSLRGADDLLGFARRGRQRSLSIHSALQPSALQPSALQPGLPVILFAAVIRSVPPHEMLEAQLDRGFGLEPDVPYQIIHVGVRR
jgi:hypothetical protein